MAESLSGYGRTQYGSDGYGDYSQMPSDTSYQEAGEQIDTHLREITDRLDEIEAEIEALKDSSGGGPAEPPSEPDPEPVPEPEPEPEPDYGANPVHQWTMSEGSGDVLHDRRGDADGEINGATWDSRHEWADGYALAGNGSSDYVDTDVDDSDGTQVAVALTVAHPFTDSDADGVANLATSGYDGDTPWEIRFNGTDLEFNAWDGEASTLHTLSEPISYISSDRPHRIVAQYGDGSMELWVDGVLVDSSSATPDSLSSSSRRLLFAHDDNGDISGHFGGTIDNVIIFDGPLSNSGIQTDLELQPWPVDTDGGTETDQSPPPAPDRGDTFDSGEPQPNSDGPFGIHEGDVDSSIEWDLEASDDFTGSLAESNWSPTFGWGRTHGSTDEYARDRDTWVSDDDRLVIQTLPGGQSGKDWYGGAANTLGNVEGNTGYWEASIKMPEPIGSMIPGFWSRGAEDLSGGSGWPPEVDFVERFGWSDGRRYASTVHYASDNSEESVRHSADELLSDGYHVYGAHWTDSHIDYYFDGQHIGRTTQGHGTRQYRLESQRHYALLTMHVWEASWNGDDPDMSADYPIHTEMDWFRFWSA